MKKTSKNKIARTYATALFEAAQQKKCVDVVWKDVASLQRVWNENKEFSSYLSSPLWKESDKISVLGSVAKKMKLQPETLECLKTVLDNHRIDDLGAILDCFKTVYYQKKGIVEVVAETVQELTASQDKKLKSTLKAVLGSEVVIDYQINPSVLGGLRIQCGSKMFDDSLSAKLNYLENVMKGK